MKNIFWLLLGTGATFLVSEYVFVPTNLYYELPWLDIPMHILGGFLIGGLSIHLLRFQNKSKLVTVTHVLAYVVFVAIIWEISEYLKGVIDYDSFSDYFDTFTDMINGIIGGLLAYKLWQK